MQFLKGAAKRLRHRDAFGLDSLIMIVSAIVIIGIMVGISRVFNGELESSYVSLTTSMPMFDQTGQYNGTGPGLYNPASPLLSVYGMLRSGTAWAMGALLVMAGVFFMLEQADMVRPSTAFGIISKGTLYFVLLFGFPPLWDLYSYAVEAGSRQILGPPANGTAPAPVARVFGTINGMGISQGKVPNVDNSVLDNLIQLFNGSPMVSGFTDQGKAFILGLVGGLIALGASFLTYLFSAIRQVLTAVLIAGLPVILLLSLVPWFHGISRRLLDTLFGLSIVPVFSSLVMVTGAAYLASISSHPVEEQWFAAVAVLTLATFVPTILVPLLGSMFSSVTSMVTSGIGYGGMMATLAARTGQGAVSGATGAVGAAQQQSIAYAIPNPGMSFARAAIQGGLRGGVGGIVSGGAGAASHLLRKAGAASVASEVKSAGEAFGRSSQRAAESEGYAVMQHAVDMSLASHSEAMMTGFGARDAPSDRVQEHMQKGANLLSIAKEARESGNYSKMTEHPYFREVPVSDKEMFGQKVSRAIMNHESEPNRLANISYNLEKMGGLNDKNIREFIQTKKANDSSHQTGKSETF